MGLNWKCPFSPFTYTITYKVGLWYFRNLCIRDTVSNKTYQNFRDKRLVRPGSKCPNWQRSQPISYKAKFCIFKVKCNITYQNNQTNFYTLKCLKWQKSYLTTYKDKLSTKSQKKSRITYQNFLSKSLVRPNSKSSICQRFQSISYKANSPRRDHIY